MTATPHIVEPIDLLTIEAYQYRMAMYGRLNYFKVIQPKLLFVLPHHMDTNYHIFIKMCCDLHSCELNCTDQPLEVLQYADNATIGTTYHNHTRGGNGNGCTCCGCGNCCAKKSWLW